MYPKSGQASSAVSASRLGSGSFSGTSGSEEEVRTSGRKMRSAVVEVSLHCGVD